MKRLLIASATLSTATFVAFAENEKGPELQVLDRFVGTWDIEGSYKPTNGDKISINSVSFRKWTANGKTLHFDDPGSDPGDPGIQILLTFDPDSKTYRGVTMMGPSRGEIKGTWDEKTATMHFTGNLGNGGVAFESNHRFIDADHAEPKGVFKNPQGEVIAEISWKQARRKNVGEISSIDELLSAYHEAVGGLETNLKTTTRRTTGTLAIAGGGEPFKMTILQKAPNLNWTMVETPDLKFLEGYDGKVMWKGSSLEGTVELDGPEKQQKLSDYQFHKYVDLKASYKALTLKGQETIEGTLYDVLEATGQTGQFETFYFDASTHHMTIVKRPDISLKMTEWKKNRGVSYSGKTEVSLPNGQIVFTMTFDQVEHGIKIDESVFAKPTE